MPAASFPKQKTSLMILFDYFSYFYLYVYDDNFPK